LLDSLLQEIELYKTGTGLLNQPIHKCS